MKKFKEAESRTQQTFLPRSVDEYVDEGDMVRYVDMLVDEFDLSAIEEAYSHMGRPGFRPDILVKLLMYGKIRGLRSSRELSRAAQENMRFIYLCQGEAPDFRTISLFRKRFHKELAELLAQTVSVGMNEGYISLEHVSVDGTKIGSFAGRNSYKDPAKIETLLKALDKSFCEDIKRDEEEDKDLGDDDYDNTLPEEVQDRHALRKKLRAALDEYRSIKGAKPKRISLTDPESRYMKGKGINPSYNLQAAVDVKSRMVVGGYAAKATCDHGELPHLLQEIERTTGQNPRNLSADKGYGLLEGLYELKERGIRGYVCQRSGDSNRYTLKDFKYDKHNDQYICPQNKTLVLNWRGANGERQYAGTECSGCAFREQCIRNKKSSKRTLLISAYRGLQQQMCNRMGSAYGKRMARIRSATVEPTFGVIKYAKKLRRFCFRGLNMISSQWKFELAALNLEKLVRFKMMQANL